MYEEWKFCPTLVYSKEESFLDGGGVELLDRTKQN
jgi:hypothetical protein